MEEMEGLIHDLGIDPDNIAGETKNERIRELILYFIRRERPLTELITALREQRPSVDWSLAE